MKLQQLTLAGLSSAVLASSIRYGSVTARGLRLSDIPSDPSSGEGSCATGWFNDTIDTNGWARLEIHTNSSCSSQDQVRPWA